MLIEPAHLRITILLQRQHAPEAGGESILGPIAEHGLAEARDAFRPGASAGFRRFLRRTLRHVIQPGLLRVPLLHPLQDALENVPFVPVMLVKRRFRHVQLARDVPHGDRFVSVLGKQLQRRLQDPLLRIRHGQPPKK